MLDSTLGVALLAAAWKERTGVQGSWIKLSFSRKLREASGDCFRRLP